MGVAGVIIMVLAVLAVGFSIYGLFNRRRSICCVLAGIVVVILAGREGINILVSGQSIQWIIAYAVMVLIGLISIYRQLKTLKKLDA